jgi:hypothetical protein
LSFGAGRRQNEVAVGRGIPPRLPQHALAKIIGMSFEINLLLEHRLPRDIENAAYNHAARFSASV